MRLAPPTHCGSAGETSHLPSLLHTGTGTLVHHYCSPLLPPLSLSPHHCHALCLEGKQHNTLRDSGKQKVRSTNIIPLVMKLYFIIMALSASYNVKALTHYALLFYSLMLASHAHYALKVNLLFSNYAPNIKYTKQNISFSIVLKHDRNRNIIF